MSYRYPCKGCTYRHIGCHDTCESYKEAVEHDQKNKKELHDSKDIDYALTGLKMNNLKKYTKKK